MVLNKFSVINTRRGDKVQAVCDLGSCGKKFSTIFNWEPGQQPEKFFCCDAHRNQALGFDPNLSRLDLMLSLLQVETPKRRLYLRGR